MPDLAPCRVPALLLASLVIAAVTPAADLDARFAYVTAHAHKDAALVAGSLRFVAPPTAARLAELSHLGLEFTEHHSRTVYPARIPPSALPALRQCDDVLRVDCAWHPPTPPPLVRALPLVEADLAHQVRSPLGGTLTGRGVTIADLDTGIELEHMAFFHLTDERYAWFDLDGSGDLSGGDAVDLDRDGLAGANETLRFHETLGYWTEGNVFGHFDPGWDLAYHDANQDGVRNVGPPDFGEQDPCYGERLFLAEDLDGDGQTTPDEPLAALGASKVRAIRAPDGTVYRRGVDLIEAPGDYYPHGTLVSGILAGGWPGLHAMVGVAPGADLLHAMVHFADEPPFVPWFADELAWAVAEGADVVLGEDGEWVWEYLDGSSNVEIMVNEFAAAGTIMVVCAGNLADGGMHCRFASADGQALTVTEGATASWPAFLWTDDVMLTLEVTPPFGDPLLLPLDGSVVTEAGFAVYSHHSVSDRGTHRIDLALTAGWPGGPAAGTWRFRFGGSDCEVHGYFHDDASGWVTSSFWEHGVESAGTVCWPATADSSITVGAFLSWDEPGEVAFFSSRGPRIDGVPLVDLIAPGANVWTADPYRWNGYLDFAGTSCSGPFVAGAAALLKELDPTLDHGRCRRYLRAGAIDRGLDPLDAGAGDLSVMAAVSLLLDDLAGRAPDAPATVSAYPNPFNAGTAIRFRQPVRGGARVRLFDVAGREVWHADVESGPPGWREISWDGRDRAGAPVPSGVYLAHVAAGGQTAAGKVTLVR